jgi:hypothetical protein
MKMMVSDRQVVDPDPLFSRQRSLHAGSFFVVRSSEPGANFRHIRKEKKYIRRNLDFLYLDAHRYGLYIFNDTLQNMYYCRGKK